MNNIKGEFDGGKWWHLMWFPHRDAIITRYGESYWEGILDRIPINVAMNNFLIG